MDDLDDGKNLESRPPTVEDLIKLCRSLNNEGAKYLVIGGMAVIQAGFVRATADIDLLDGGVQEIIIEMKVLHDSLEKTIEKGIEQTWKYMDKCHTGEGHLVIFDLRIERTWEEKIFHREKAYKGKKIKVRGM